MIRTSGALLALLLASVLPAAGDWVGERLCADGLPREEFGFAVAIGDSVIAVGDYRNDVVYLFDRDEAGECRLVDTISGDSGSWFGFALASDGRQLLIGAPRSGDTGAAYLYDLTKDPAERPETLTVPQARSGDEFGSSVAISESKLAIGARGTDSRRGRVYFRTDGSFEAVPLPGLAPNAELGQSVALSGTTLVMGAPHPYRASGSPGRAWVFEIGGDEPPIPLTPPGSLEPEAAFGYAVAVHGNHILVGAPLEDRGGTDTGTVYSFERGGAGWTPGRGPQPLLVGGRGDQLGVAVALENRTAVVGARYAEGNRGAVWIAGLFGGALSLQPPGVPAGAQLGSSVAIRNGIMVAGAFREGGTGAAYRFVPSIRLALEVSEVLESAGTVTVTVKAAERASRDVTVQISTEDGTATAEDKDYERHTESITLPAGQMEVKKALSILLDDQECEAREFFSLALFDPPGGEAVERVPVTIRDDEQGGLELAPDPMSTFEDGTPAPLSVRLTCPPFKPVKVSLDGSAGFSPAELTFTEENWSQPRTVSVTGRDNETCERFDTSYPIRATTTSADTRYAGLSRTIFAENADDDMACLAVAESTVCADGGGTVVYTIALVNEAADVPDAPAELRSTLPSGVTVVTASADRGIATADPVANSVRWSGTVPPEGDGAAIITIVAALDELPGPVLENSATLTWVRDSRGHAESLPVVFEGMEILPCP